MKKMKYITSNASLNNPLQMQIFITIFSAIVISAFILIILGVLAVLLRLLYETIIEMFIK